MKFSYVSDSDYGEIVKNQHREYYGISTPNMLYIPLPYIGTVEVHLRADYRYGVNDPFQWPQNFTEQYDFLCAVPRPEAAPIDYAPLWWTPTQNDFKLIEGSVFTCIGSLRREAARPLFDLSAAMESEIFARAQQAPLDTRVVGLHVRLQQARDRLHHQPSTFRDVCFQVRELQRSWLMCRAIIDYADLTIPSSSMKAVNVRLMGAFMTSAAVVQHLHASGIPVWFIRQDGSFNRSQMEEVMDTPHRPTDIEMRRYTSNSPALWCGPSDERQLDVICKRHHHYVDVSVAPLLYRYDTAAYYAGGQNKSVHGSASSSRQPYGTARHAPCWSIAHLYFQRRL